jgi:hypothetical protein
VIDIKVDAVALAIEGKHISAVALYVDGREVAARADHRFVFELLEEPPEKTPAYGVTETGETLDHGTHCLLEPGGVHGGVERNGKAENRGVFAGTARGIYDCRIL